MQILTLIVVLAVIATAVSLGLGIRSMMRGGEYDNEHSSQLMALRVGAQGLAFALMLVALYLI